VDERKRFSDSDVGIMLYNDRQREEEQIKREPKDLKGHSILSFLGRGGKKPRAVGTPSSVPPPFHSLTPRTSCWCLVSVQFRKLEMQKSLDLVQESYNSSSNSCDRIEQRFVSVVPRYYHWRKYI
jgi:hypothetical protein